MATSHSQISAWGNGLALRLTKPMAKAAGVTAGTRVRIIAKPGRIEIGFPMTHAEFNADNPFALAVKGPKGDVGFVLAFQPKSFDWRARNAHPHPWGAGHNKVLGAALKKLDTICGVCNH